jgi:hypothetical protein
MQRETLPPPIDVLRQPLSRQDNFAIPFDLETQNMTDPFPPTVPGQPFFPQEGFPNLDDFIPCPTIENPGPSPFLDQTFFDLMNGFEALIAGLSDYEGQYSHNNWATDACNMPPAFFPSNLPLNIDPLAHQVVPQSQEALYAQAEYDLFGVAAQLEQPPSSTRFPRQDSHNVVGVSPTSTTTTNSSSPLSDLFDWFDPLSPLFSATTSSPGSSISSVTSLPPTSPLGKRPCDLLADATTPSHIFQCQWQGCNKSIPYTPNAAGGLPDVLRCHIQHHYPAVQKHAEVDCLWGSCNKKTPRDNLRKHILKHLPEFHYRCAGCGVSYQRSERWKSHVEKCERRSDSDGQSRPLKRAKRTASDS